MQRYRVLLASLGIATLLGCSFAMSQRERAQMDSLVGKLTYREAMKRWGVPLTTRDTPEELTAIWRAERWDTVDVGGRNPRYCDEGEQACISTPGVAPGTSTMRSGFERILVFDRRTQVLKSWDYKHW